MKTLNELYNEVITSEELQNEIQTLKTPEELVAFVAKHGCDASLDDITAFFEEKEKALGELSEEELERVAGGKGYGGGAVKGIILLFKFVKTVIKTCSKK